MGVRFDWKAESSSKTEICKLDLRACCVDEQILGLEISVEDAVLMEIDERLQNLVKETLSLLARESCSLSSVTHVLLQVKLEVLKHQVQLLLRVDHLL